ncbi:MAG: M20/M25/M40 family metallo-hydrolase [Solirubrobacteraceae bacterium]|nr:M20/M25/M40 family metallo-hydrolase [Solirubrobacteraceae bacterium]
MSAADRVRQLMPELRRDLEALVRIPSVSAPGVVSHELLEACALTESLFQSVGVATKRLELPGTAPIVTGEIPAPPGAPTVLLYSHYDVVGPGDLSLWDSPPFEPTERDGAIFGRGTGDTKSNILMHVGALRAWDGKPPVGVKILIEGHEESGSGGLLAYPASDPQLFKADALVIADSGSLAPGLPTITTALRGVAQLTVELRTLESGQHSGLYGGAAPDALLALIRALGTLHDEQGDVAVAGLRREPWPGEGMPEDTFRELGTIRDGLPLIGTGDLGSRIWSGPAITVIGLDAPSVDGALNAVSPYARAMLNVRVHPDQDATEAQQLVAAHLEAVKPYGLELTVTGAAAGNGYSAPTGGPAYLAAVDAWSAAYGRDTIVAGSGGAIPVVSALARAGGGEVLVVGTCDGFANIHGPNERVLLDEFERATIAEADWFGRYAERFGS